MALITEYKQYYILDITDMGPSSVNLESNSCLTGSELFRGLSSIADPIELWVESGRKFRDILTTTWGSVCIFRERISDIFEIKGFTGWRRYPVSIHDRQGQPVLGYCGISITGYGAPVDRNRGEKVVTSPKGFPDLKFKHIKGLYLEGDFYDGSDVFAPEGTSLIIVKEAVKDALSGDKGLGLSFVPMNEYLLIDIYR